MLKNTEHRKRSFAYTREGENNLCALEYFLEDSEEKECLLYHIIVSSSITTLGFCMDPQTNLCVISV